jgi:hypothetical protein
MTNPGMKAKGSNSMKSRTELSSICNCTPSEMQSDNGITLEGYLEAWAIAVH